jgi:two-component system, NtrC family, sensor kinase
MSTDLHESLQRQVRKIFGSLDACPVTLLPLLEAVSQSYAEADRDRVRVERSLDLMSTELNERNKQLRSELEDKQSAQDELQRTTGKQQTLIKKLEDTHHQLLQSEKMASIGQLAAGVAHEINNPIGFVSSNLGTLRDYVGALIAIVATYESLEGGLPPEARARVAALKREHDYGFLCDDVKSLLAESAEGIKRVKQIAQDLKDFSHVDEQAWQWADLHKGLNSTLNIVQNELKYVADVDKRYADIPEIECHASQLNQVFLNLLVNAGHAIKDKRGRITIRTGRDGDDHVFVEISDDGHGIAAEHLMRIFDPFFTTKPVGKGTGLGLSLSYGIVRDHNGRIEVASQVGKGSTFRVVLPIRRAVEAVETVEAPAAQKMD